MKISTCCITTVAVIAAVTFAGCGAGQSINWAGVKTIVASVESGAGAEQEEWQYFVLEGELVQELRQAVEQNTEFEGRDGPITGSIGLVCLDESQRPLRVVSIWRNSLAIGDRDAEVQQGDVTGQGQMESREQIVAVVVKGQPIDQAEFDRIHPSFTYPPGVQEINSSPFLRMQTTYYRE